jgi:hypothetical protein
MDGKTKPNELYIVEPYNASNQEQNDSKDINEDRPLKGEDEIITMQLFNIRKCETTKYH